MSNRKKYAKKKPNQKPKRVVKTRSRKTKYKSVRKKPRGSIRKKTRARKPSAGRIRAALAKKYVRQRRGINLFSRMTADEKFINIETKSIVLRKAQEINENNYMEVLAIAKKLIRKHFSPVKKKNIYNVSLLLRVQRFTDSSYTEKIDEPFNVMPNVTGYYHELEILWANKFLKQISTYKEINTVKEIRVARHTYTKKRKFSKATKRRA